MPSYQESLKVEIDSETALLLACEAFFTLDWPIQFGTDSNIIGTTSKNFSKTVQQVTCGYINNELTVSSEMITGELFDLTGRNKKNVTAFISEYKNQLQLLSPSVLEKNKPYFIGLKHHTSEAITAQEKEFEEINKAMKPNGSNLYATYAIIGINILVFILMVFDGAGLIEPNGIVHMKWGSNYTPLTQSGDWWRLITNTFIHFGIIHILMNMYCLFTVGSYLEPMLGKIKYVTAYLCTGVIASIVSLWWHSKEGANAAGASGAVFGMYGLFLALLTTNLIPKSVRDSLLKSIGIFIFYNLAFGMKGGVDNAAHVGGLVSGFVMGYLYVISIRKEKTNQKVNWVVPLVVLITFCLAFFYLQNNISSSKDRSAALALIKDASYKDNEKFNIKYNEFVEIQTRAVQVINDKSLSENERKEKLTTISLKEWDNAEAVIKQMQQMNVSDNNKRKASELLRYTALQKENVAMSIRIIDREPGALETQNEIIKQINEIVETLK